jgi:hypothetical protein
MKEINVVKPFTYYIDGYQRQDFAIGKHEVPHDCAAYATTHGFAEGETRKKEVKVETKDDGADKPSGSKKAPAS